MPQMMYDLIKQIIGGLNAGILKAQTFAVECGKIGKWKIAKIDKKMPLKIFFSN